MKMTMVAADLPAFQFGCLADARAFCDTFFVHYNHSTDTPGMCTPRPRCTTAPRPRSLRSGP
jgi:hypothetical protein